MRDHLEGKVALITGAARGQGAAAARRLVADGARVVLCDVLDDEGKAEAEGLGEAASYQRLDVVEEDDWGTAIEALEERYGRLDVLVNNAGILRLGSIEDLTLEDYLEVVRVNQVGVFLGMRAAIPAMRRAGGGSIVNISSIEGMVGSAHLAAYASTKFAVRGLTKVAALELAGDGIRVNSVHPGMIRSPMTEGLGDVSAAHRVIPAGRPGEPEDVVGLVAYLASDDAGYCTGAEFVVDGGVLAGSVFSAVFGA